MSAAPELFPEAPALEAPDVASSTDAYARRFSGAVGEFLLARQAELVLQLLAPWPRARVLDVGGGHAQIALPLVRAGYQVTATGSRDSCRERLDRLLPAGSFEFRRCDLLDLPFPDRSFDAVVSLRVLSHLERWQALVAEMCRVARHAVVLDYPDLRSFNLLYSPLFRLKRSLEGHTTRTFRCFGPREVIAEAARQGFGSAVVRRQFFLPIVIHRALGNAGASRTAEAASRRLGLTAAFGSPVVLRVTPSGTGE